MIHKYESNGYYIVIDTNSGAVHVLDRLAYDLLDYAGAPMEEAPPEAAYALGAKSEIDECWSELKYLCDSGLLFTPDDENLKNFTNIEAPIKSMCLHAAHDCNLKCRYCFAGEGFFGGERCRLDRETAHAAIDFLIRNSGSRHNLELDFFGGEPLLNYPVIKDTVEYARSLEAANNKLFRFTVTTNGMMLGGEMYEYLNREMSNIVLSLDGRKEVHDRMRPKYDGSGSYDTIVPKFQKMTKMRGSKDYYVRGTFTCHNLDFSEDVFHLAELGFEQISVEPVVAPKTEEYALQETDLPAILAEYDRLAKRIIEYRRSGKYFNFFHFMVDTDEGPCAIKRVKGCGCGNEYVAVAANGDIYPCHRFVGVEGFKMGNVRDGKIDEDLKRKFTAANIFTKSDCKNCWAKFFCSGGCCANNYFANGDILKTDKFSCELEKKRVECAVMIKAALGEF